MAVGLPEGFVLDAEPAAAGGLPPGFVLDESGPAKKDERTLLGTVVAGVKAAGAGAIGTLANVIDPTPMWGLEKTPNPIRPDLEPTKKAAAEVVDQQRAEYAPGIVGQGTGMATEIAANPLNYVGGRGAELAKLGTEAVVQGGRKLIQAATGGAASGFLQGVGTEDSRTANTAIGAAAGPVVEKAAEAVGGVVRGAKDVVRGVRAKTPEQWQEVGAGLKRQSQQTYKAMRDAGAVINKKTVNSIVDDLETSISANGKVNADLHRNSLSVLQDLKALRNKPLGLEEADQYRQLLNDVVSSGTDGTGKMNPDALKALNLIDVLDERIERLGNSNMVGKAGADVAGLLKQARQEWGQYRRFDKVAALVDRYGDNPGVLKNQVRLLLLNKKATRGFNEQELAALRKLSQKGGLEGFLRLAGRAGIDLKNPGANLVGPALGTIAGTAAADAATGGAVTAGATLARLGSQAIGRGQADQALGTLAGINAGPEAVRAFTAPRVTGGVAAVIGNAVKPQDNGQRPERTSAPVAAPQPKPQASTGTGQEEGFSTKVYKDSRGIRTVGRGFNMQQVGARKIWSDAGIEVPFNDVLTGRAEISSEDADKLHDVMMGKAATSAPSLVKGFDTLSANRQDVIRDMLYQLGEGEAKKFAPTFKLIEKGRFEDAAARLKKAKVASQSPNRVARNIYMLVHNVSREDAEKALVASGKLKKNARIYA